MNKDYAEIITRCVFEDLLKAFHEAVKVLSTKGIRETVHVMSTIKNFLETKAFSDEEKQKIAECKIDYIKALSKETKENFKKNMSKIVAKFKENKESLTVITDAIDAVLFIQLSNDMKEIAYASVFRSKLVDFKMTDYNKSYIHNINVFRNLDTPEKCYPECDRPRGLEDLVSVRHHCKILQQGKELEPIWMLNIHGKRYILDGFHRIAATCCEKRPIIKCYYVKM